MAGHIWFLENEEDDKRDEAVAVTKFYMFYAKQDHWVADHVRDEFIAKREEHSGRGGRTSIAVDESGALKHAFCTRQGKANPHALPQGEP